MSSISLMFSLVAASLVICFLVKEGNPTLDFLVERNALLKFKVRFSDPLRVLQSWNSTNIDCCKWQGVKCNKIIGHVIGVNLLNEKFNVINEVSIYNYESLSSEILDSSIMELKQLSFLDLSGNNFQHGPIPTFLRSMNQLQHLNLSIANFSGVIPNQLGNLSRLSVLDLSDNGYHSLIVDDFMWVSRLSSLMYLDMSSVDLTRTKDMLKVLNMLISIATLRLLICGLTNRNLQHACAINSTTLLPNIQHLDLSKNSFEGELPCFLESTTLLEDLYLSSNSYNSCNQFIHPIRLTNLVNLELSNAPGIRPSNPFKIIVTWNHWTGVIIPFLGT